MEFTGKKFDSIKSFFKDRDDKIYGLMVKHGYIPLPPPKSLYAWVVSQLIGQRIKFSLARKLREKLFTLLRTHDPLPDDINKIGLPELIKMGLGERISSVIWGVTQYALKYPITMENIDSLNIKGIGSWTRKTAKLMYSIGNPLEIPLEDSIIRRGIADLYGSLSDHPLWDIYTNVAVWYIWKEYT